MARDSVRFVGESAGVERRDADCVRWVRDELDARSVVVEAKSKLTDPLGYGDGRDSERAERIGLPEGKGGGGVRERSLPPGRGMSRRGAGEPGAEKARLLLSLVMAWGCPSESAIPGVFSERMRKRPGREGLGGIGVKHSRRRLGRDTVGSISHFGDRHQWPFCPPLPRPASIFSSFICLPWRATAV